MQGTRNSESTHSAARQPKLLDKMRQVLRTKHYSYRTEQAYVDWAKRFVLYHQMRHPREMAGSTSAITTSRSRVAMRIWAIDPSRLRPQSCSQCCAM